MHTLGAPFWIWSPIENIRWSTLLTFVALGVIVTVRTRKPILGLVAPMAWLSGYEILYQATGAALHDWSRMTLLYTTTGTAGWLIAGYALGIRPGWWIVGIFAGLWIIWIALGFDSNMPDRIIIGADRLFSWRDEFLNVATKTAFAVVVVLGALKAKSDNRQVRAV